MRAAPVRTPLPLPLPLRGESPELLLQGGSSPCRTMPENPP